ncbi:MAG: DUF5591 domain-containing protein [Candidatus Saliniplasma sp.]
MIEITERWGLAKKGKFSLGDKEFTCPNILFLDDEYFSPPPDAEITISTDGKGDIKVPETLFDVLSGEGTLPTTFGYPENIGGRSVSEEGGSKRIQILYDQEPRDDADIYVIGNSPQLLSRSRDMFEKITTLREKIPYHKLIYTPGIAQPQNMALLTYLGVDLFDSVSAEYFEMKGVQLSGWMGFYGDGTDNKRKMMDELKLIRNAIEKGRIRELVETRVRSEPWQVEVLRMLDGSYPKFSKEVPVTGEKVNVTTREALNRPDIKRFITRIQDRYSPPSRPMLLLLPCSASKPYFLSRTHSRIRQALQGTPWTSVHEVILTSPLGAVPREIEMFYPAKQYDIPVSKTWFEEEKELILEQLNHLLDKGSYGHVISHLPPDMDFVKQNVDCIDTVSEGYHLDKDALDRLRDEINSLNEGNNQGVKRFLWENIRSLAIFQFGLKAGEALLKGAYIKGRYPEYRIMEDGTQLGMLVSERGLISLTIDGAEKVLETGEYQAEIDDFRPKGSVFAVGVKDADRKIHPEDEVILVHKGELKGVGPASMSGVEMIHADRGEAVRVRHYV